MDKLGALLFLKELSGVGPARINKFYLPELKQGMDLNELVDFVQHNESKLSPEAISTAYDNAQRTMGHILSMDNVGIVTVADNDYPRKLKSLGNRCPVVLFYRGDLSIVEEDSIAIIGTREPSDWSQRVEAQLTNKIIELSDRVIISGLAIGCDTVAHRACIDAGGKTVAVLPCGINNISPEENKTLCDEIVSSGGLLISEYYPAAAATQYTFVERDTLIAAFSDATFVIECGIKSGTMHTVDAAEKLKRRVAAYFCEVAGKGHYEGNQHIIDNMGASKVFDTNSLKEFLESLKNEESEPIQLSLFDSIG